MATPATPTRFGMRRSDSSVFSATPPPRAPTPKDLAGKSSADIHARVQANFSAAEGYRPIRRRSDSPFGTTAPAAVSALMKIEPSSHAPAAAPAVAPAPVAPSQLITPAPTLVSSASADVATDTKPRNLALSMSTSSLSGHGSAFGAATARSPSTGTRRLFNREHEGAATRDIVSNKFAHRNSPSPASQFYANAAGKARTPLAHQSTSFRFGRDPKITVGSDAHGAHNPILDDDHDGSTPFRPSIRVLPRPHTATEADTFRPIGGGSRAMFISPNAHVRHSSVETTEPEFRTALRQVAGHHVASESDRLVEHARLRPLHNLPWHHLHPTDPILQNDPEMPQRSPSRSPSASPVPSDCSSSPDASPSPSPVPHVSFNDLAPTPSASMMRTASAPTFFTPATSVSPDLVSSTSPVPQAPPLPPRLHIQGEQSPGPAASANKTYAGLAAARNQHQYSSSRPVTSTGFVPTASPNTRGVRPQSVKTFSNSNTFRTTFETAPTEPPRPIRRMYADNLAALDLASPRTHRTTPMFPPPASLVSTSRPAYIAGATPVASDNHHATFVPLRPAGKPSGTPLGPNYDFVFFTPCASPFDVDTRSAVDPPSMQPPPTPSSGTVMSPRAQEHSVYPTQPLSPPRRLKKTPSWLPTHSPEVIRNEYARGSSASERKTRDTRKERQAMVAKLMSAAPSTYFSVHATANSMKSLMNESKPWLIQHSKKR